MKKKIVKLTESDLERIVKKVISEDVTKVELVTKYRGSVEQLINSLNEIVSNQDFCGNLKTGLQTANGKIDQLVNQIQSNEKVDSADEALGQLVDQVSKTQKGLIGGIIKKVIGGKQFEMSKEMKDGIMNHMSKTYPKNGPRAVQVINNFINQSGVTIKPFCEQQQNNNNQKNNTNTKDSITLALNKAGVKDEYLTKLSDMLSGWIEKLPAEYKK